MLDQGPQLVFWNGVQGISVIHLFVLPILLLLLALFESYG